MFGSLPLFALIAIFGGAAAAVWLAGTRLSDSTDVLSTRLRIGETFGGLILLAVATNLPEVAITLTAALAHNLRLAIGNILGGIAIQTVVLVILELVLALYALGMAGLVFVTNGVDPALSPRAAR